MRARTYPASPANETSRTPTTSWDLVQRAQAGDQAAFGELFRRYQPLLLRYVYLQVRDRQLAEDLTSETFVRALRSIEQFATPTRDFGAWLQTVARNLAIDHSRSGWARLVVPADLSDRAGGGVTYTPLQCPEGEAIRRDVHAILHAAIDQLTPRQRQVIACRFFNGMSTLETAAEMGKTPGATKAIQHLACRSLERLLPSGFGEVWS